jgi:hypothetical protein
MSPMRALMVPLLSLLAAPVLAQPTVTAEPAPAHVPLTLSLDAHRAWHLDRSYRLFGTRRSDVEGGLSAALEVRRLGRGRLDLGAGVQWGSETGRWEQVNEARREQVTPSLAAVVRWPVHRWFEPHVRLAGDLTRARLRLTVSDGGVLEDRVWAPGASAGAGFRLRTGVITTALRGGTLGFAGALIVEGGYHLGAPLSFELGRQAPADKKVAADRIPAPGVPVGNLGRAEPYLRISFALLI